MARALKHLLAFNRGVVSKLGLARFEVDRLSMSAEIQRNYVPRVLGSMMIRPGLEFIDRTNSDATVKARQIGFTFGVDDTAAIELSDVTMRVRINDVLITRPSVSAAVTNGGFDVSIANWTDRDEAGATSSWVAGGYLSLVGTGDQAARVTQQVTVTETGVEHALRIKVNTGDVRVRIGNAEFDDTYINETLLDVGEHSLSFTPTGDFWIELANVNEYKVWVDSCEVEVAGTMEILTKWGEDDLPFLRYDQSGDIIYVACLKGESGGLDVNARQLQKIERRGDGRSWSVVRYLPVDGPFRVLNTTPTTMAPDAISGECTITASKAFFRTEHSTFNSLIRIASNGQTVAAAISAQDTWSNVIRVTGSESARAFQVTVSGTFVATVRLQFAFTEDGPWNDTDQSWTAPVNTSYNDGQEDSIVYYRIGVKSGEYTSGTANVSLVYANGSIQGIARINTVTNSTTATASILKDFGGTDASKDWWEGEWSAYRGNPTAVELHEGRLWWFGLDRVWGSISDAYESFDDNFEGDAGPISRRIGWGPIRVIHWAMSLGRLMFGTSDNSANVAPAKMDGNHPLGARSNSFDEPLTPFNFNIKTISSRGVFVDRTKQRLYELVYDIDQQDYKSLDLSVFAPDFNEIGITQIAVQMKPDIRIHCVRADGTVGMLVYDRLENVMAWVDVDSTGATGLIEDVSVLPGVVEDQVYYIVKRTINGATQRHLCKWAKESEAMGATVNKIADSFVHYSGAATTTPFTTELLHLRDEDVVVWADGKEVTGLTVTSAGALTLTTAASEVTAGLGYTAQYKSARLGDIQGIGFMERMKINRIGFIARKLHYRGIQYGPDFTNLNDMPSEEQGEFVAADTVWEDYHEDNFPFGGDWSPDSRICLQSQAPRPATILGVTSEFESVENRMRRR